jgi:hypothetical protein
MTTSDASATETVMSRQERLIFIVYAVMGAIIVTFLATSFALWSAGV